jgi:hypothetical protein
MLDDAGKLFGKAKRILRNIREEVAKNKADKHNPLIPRKHFKT